jgi:hypothetical protein
MIDGLGFANFNLALLAACLSGGVMCTVEKS